MSSNPRATAGLRSSLKKQTVQAQSRARNSDMKRHVTFATPKLPAFKRNMPRHQQISEQKNTAKFSKAVVETHRKRIPSARLEELRIKKNKHNEQFVRLCEAQETLVRTGYVTKRLNKVAEEQEKAAAALLTDAVSLIETDVLRNFEEHEITDFLDNVEQQQKNRMLELQKELTEFDDAINTVEEMLKAVEKCNDALDAYNGTGEMIESIPIVDEMKIVNDEIGVYISVLDSLKQFHL